MITNLREAKANLSRLVQLAAEGEEVVITVHGEPKALLTGLKTEKSSEENRESWVKEIVKSAKANSTGKTSSTSQEYWDESRGDR